EPDAVVLVKKRAFSSLAENYRVDYMNQEEKLYMKATRFLFQNKCRQISTFEKLSKIARIGEAAGSLDAQLMPLIMSLVDSAAGDFADYSTGSGTGAFSGFNESANNAAAAPFKQLSNTISAIRK